MKTLITLMLCGFSVLSLAQDERYFRSIYSGEDFNQLKSDFMYKIEVKSPKYSIDLNRDGKKDSIQAVKRDGVDFIQINNEYGQMVFSKQLSTKGKNSHIFRASFKKISNRLDVIILHFLEGENQSAVYTNSARLYFITIKERDFSKIQMTKGPFFWMEYEGVAGKYYNRRYTVNTTDYNKDGVREISTSFNNISRIYFYKKGRWLKL